MSSPFNYREASETNARLIVGLKDELASLRAQLADALAQLARREEWTPVPEDVPLNSFGDYMHNRTLFVRCTIAGNGSILHGYTLNEGEYLVRRQPGGAKEEG